VERILNRGGEPSEVLSAVLEALHARGVSYGAVRPVGGGELSIGSPTVCLAAPVASAGATVGSLELAVVDDAFVVRVATLISPYVAQAAVR
jgi:hypothetical protein